MQRGMTSQAEFIADIEGRAAALGVPVYMVCRAADVAPSTFYRWKDGVGANLATIERVRDELARLEAERAQ